MTYFLDFDRTLIDNERLHQYLSTLPEWSSYHQALTDYARKQDGTSAFTAEAREAMYQGMDALYAAGKYKFHETEIAPFLYDDVLPFLRAHGRETVIVTAGHNTLEYQRAKLDCSGVAGLVARIEFVQEEAGHKGPVLARLIHEYQSPYLFVDDKESQLDVVHAAVPDVSVYHMVRDYATKPSKKYHVISSLEDLL